MISLFLPQIERLSGDIQVVAAQLLQYLSISYTPQAHHAIGDYVF